jgi:hypothetical protein
MAFSVLPERDHPEQVLVFGPPFIGIQNGNALGHVNFATFADYGVGGLGK